VPVRLLVLGPFATTAVSEARANAWTQRVRAALGRKVQLFVGDPPFEIEGDLEGKGYWMRPHHPKPDERRKLLRKQVFTGLVLALMYVV